MKTLILSCVLALSTSGMAAKAPQPQEPPMREHLLMDFGWLFAYGHATDADKDFGHGTAYFSYFAKAVYGADGPARTEFDDRAWRKLDLPHDWAVEQGFDAKASHSHGYKTVGRPYPASSVGWYRKSFFVPASDLGRRISIQFDGVHRDSVVWINGNYLGRHPNGTVGFIYDLTPYLNYGGDNVVTLRADVTMEEGWYYEGAGIYRHVWLNKTAPLHVEDDGVFVTSTIKDEGPAILDIRTTMLNEANAPKSFEMRQQVLNSRGKVVATLLRKDLPLFPGESREFNSALKVDHPELWSLETPTLYRLVTQIELAGQVVDRVETSFGIRSIRFDADQGFFLNNKHVKLKGSNNHQDHAGVGTAMPDALQDFRIHRLKEMGSNAYRCSHNPPTPELLDACDRLGMLVLVENRLMGTSPELKDLLKKVILRDRNHPSVFAWSMGNEEWGLEGNIMGARIVSEMQAFTKRLDPSRPATAAVSGGNDEGISSVTELMGYNYIDQWNTDRHHAKYPWQPAMGTEESTSSSARDIYLDEDKAIAHAAPTSRSKDGSSVEKGWKHYAERPYLAGLFYWTGFDYRGESNPFGYPAVSSQFGLLDLCGFPKDPTQYLKAWWTDEPVLELAPHWTWKGHEGELVQVWAQSNCEEVELFLNHKSLGKKTMLKNSHLEWQVPYAPGVLSATGFSKGKAVLSRQIRTAGPAKAVSLVADRSTLKADGEDLALVTVQIEDARGDRIPNVSNEVGFSIEGPGHIIGVGNGDPSSHEADRFFDSVSSVKIRNLKMLRVDSLGKRPEVAADFNDAAWQAAFLAPSDFDPKGPAGTAPQVIRGEFELGELPPGTQVTLFPKSINEVQSIYVNGKLVAKDLPRDSKRVFVLDAKLLHPGKNVYATVGTPLQKKHSWENLNTDPGMLGVISPAAPWKRKAFNGLAQVIVQTEKKPGTITLRASSKGLASAKISLSSKKVILRPAVP